MKEIARTVLISAVSGVIAFAGAVLYLGGDDSERAEPALTRADVQAMIDDVLIESLTRVDVQAMIDDVLIESLTRADVQAMIDDVLIESLTRTDVQAMINFQPRELTAPQAREIASNQAFAALTASAQYAVCLDTASVQMGTDLLRDTPADRASDLFQRAALDCWDAARDRFYNDGE